MADYDIFVEFDKPIRARGDECWISFTEHRTVLRPVDPDWPVAKESLVYIQPEKNFLSFRFEEDSGCTRGLYSMNTTYPLEIGNLVQHYGTWVPRVRFACVDKQSSVDYRDCHMPEHFRR